MYRIKHKKDGPILIITIRAIDSDNLTIFIISEKHSNIYNEALMVKL